MWRPEGRAAIKAAPTRPVSFPPQADKLQSRRSGVLMADTSGSKPRKIRVRRTERDPRSNVGDALVASRSSPIFRKRCTVCSIEHDLQRLCRPPRYAGQDAPPKGWPATHTSDRRTSWPTIRSRGTGRRGILLRKVAGQDGRATISCTESRADLTWH